jgi:cbb3-type cytochrome oxidase cytochrome c subunit
LLPTLLLPGREEREIENRGGDAMNSACLIFFGVFVTFVASWWGIVFAPQLQIGSQQPKAPEGATVVYPNARPGIAAQGHQVYVSQGCVYCHSQQSRQEGYTFDVVLSGTTNAQATAAALDRLKVPGSAQILSSASEKSPQTILKNISLKEASAADTALKEAGAMAGRVFIPTGADMARGWGVRQSVAQDYLQDHPVQIGNSRLGPDLTNIGARQPDAAWHLLHLYTPRIVVKGSTMPAYQYLFEERKIGRAPSPNALKLPPEFAPAAGYEIIPKPEALTLAAYLQSLQTSVALFEAPATQLPQAQPAASTNAPAATNAPANTPSK